MSGPRGPARLGAAIAQLREALGTREGIGQATGLLMARYQLDADRAFAVLVRLSQESSMKLRDVAARVGAEATPAMSDAAAAAVVVG